MHTQGTGLTGPHAVGMGQVQCQPLEGNEGVSVWEIKAWDNTSDVPGRTKGGDTAAVPVLAPHLARGTGARGDPARLLRTRSSARLLAKHLLPWGFCPPTTLMDSAVTTSSPLQPWKPRQDSISGWSQQDLGGTKAALG